MIHEPERSNKSSFTRMMDNLFFSTIPGMLLFMGAWELFVRFVGNYIGAPDLFPGVSAIAYRAYEMIFLSKGNCPLCIHTTATVIRFFSGVGIAIGIFVGFSMGRNQWLENLFAPALRILLPIPALGIVPILVIWFGNGGHTVIYITALATTLPIIAATWDGAKATKPNPASPSQSMGQLGTDPSEDETSSTLMPSILTGIRIGLARGRTAVIAGEAFAGIKWGLGAGLFDAQEYLDVGFILVCLTTIFFLALLIEKLIIQTIERVTVVKWGMNEVRITNPSYTFF